MFEYDGGFGVEMELLRDREAFESEAPCSRVEGALDGRRMVGEILFSLSSRNMEKWKIGGISFPVVQQQKIEEKITIKEEEPQFDQNKKTLSLTEFTNMVKGIVSI